MRCSHSTHLVYFLCWGKPWEEVKSWNLNNIQPVTVVRTHDCYDRVESGAVVMMEENLCFLCQKPSTSKCKHCNLVYHCTDHHLKLHRPGKQCFPFIIKQSTDKGLYWKVNKYYRHKIFLGSGRFMVAVRDIAALETILVERAAACGPKLQHSLVCVECSKADTSEYSWFIVNCEFKTKNLQSYN